MSPSGPAAKVKEKFSQPGPAPNKVSGRNQNTIMEKLENDPPPTDMGIPPTENLPPGQEASHGLNGKHSSALEQERDDPKMLWSDGATRLAQPPVNVDKQSIQWSTALSALYYLTLAAQRTV